MRVEGAFAGAPAPTRIFVICTWEDYFPDVASALRFPGKFGDNLLADETRTPFVPRRWETVV